MFTEYIISVLMLYACIIYTGYKVSDVLSRIFSLIRTIEKSTHYDPYLFADVRLVLNEIEILPIIILFALILCMPFASDTLLPKILVVVSYLIGAAFDVHSTVYVLYHGKKQGFNVYELNPFLFFVNFIKTKFLLKLTFYIIEIIVITSIVSHLFRSSPPPSEIMLMGVLGIIRMMAGIHNLRTYILLLENRSLGLYPSV